MSLIPWRNKSSEASRAPIPASEFRSEIERVFDRFFSDPWEMSNSLFSTFGRDRSWHPSVDMTEDDKSVTVKVEVPGVDPGKVDVSVNGNVLTVRGEKSEEREKGDSTFHHSERCFGSFSRSIELPSNVDGEDARAEHQNGVLTITFGKVKGSESRKIPVLKA